MIKTKATGPNNTDEVARTAVLLGAGASADAGLPLTSALAAKVIARANELDRQDHFSAKPDWVRALNAVYAGMVGYQGARGENPLTTVNIETLISAVRLLRSRDTHEVAPFVSTWTPSLSNFGSSNLPTESGHEIVQAVGSAMGGSGFGGTDRDVTNAVANIARAAIRPDLAQPFADAEHFILASLIDLLGAHQDVSYFEPLLQLARSQAGGVDVITLNYDLTVETAAEQGGVSVARGIERWRPGEHLNFPLKEQTINLVKLHGSLDWRAQPPKDSESSLTAQLTPHEIAVVAPDVAGGYRQNRRSDLPWIVLGDREKLATDGPTLALNFAARTALLRTKHLAVVGYSFGDTHINLMIRDWLAADDSRTMSILDLQWPRVRDFRDATDFRSALISKYGYGGQNDYWSGSAFEGGQPTHRVQPLEGRTSELLGQALFGDPPVAPDTLVTVVATQEDHAFRFEVTWHGPQLSDATLRGWPNQHVPSTNFPPPLRFYDSTPIPADNLHHLDLAQGNYEVWPTGLTFTVYAALETVFPINISVGGASIVGRQSAECEVKLPAVEAPII